MPPPRPTSHPIQTSGPLGIEYREQLRENAEGMGTSWFPGDDEEESGGGSGGGGGGGGGGGRFKPPKKSPYESKNAGGNRGRSQGGGPSKRRKAPVVGPASGRRTTASGNNAMLGGSGAHGTQTRNRSGVDAPPTAGSGGAVHKTGFRVDTGAGALKSKQDLGDRVLPKYLRSVPSKIKREVASERAFRSKVQTETQDAMVETLLQQVTITTTTFHHRPPPPPSSTAITAIHHHHHR